MTTAYLNFHGAIYSPQTTRLRNAICQIVNERDQQGAPKYQDMVLLLNSTGGSLDDGLSLYSLLRSVPLNLTTVNMGMIASIAIAPFLAGDHRICCPTAFFHFHGYDWNYPAAHTQTRQQFADHTQLLDAARDATFELLKAHTALTAKDFESLKLIDQPVIKSSAFAKEKGIVQEIGLPQIPAGSIVFNVDY